MKFPTDFHPAFPPSNRLYISVLFALASLNTIGACHAQSNLSSAVRANINNQSTKESQAEYLLGPYDVLDITVSNHPNLNATVTVRPDGKIALSRAGELIASDKSAVGLAKEIQKRLSISLNNARVQVVVKQARPRNARITGAVKSAGTYIIGVDARVVDLLALAGGLNAKATRISGKILRANKTIPLDINKAVTDPSSAANISIRPDDLVVLDAQDYSKQITVTGSVLQPGAYDLDENLTVIRLLAQAGGVTPNASLRKAQILRDGKPVLSDLSDTISGYMKPNSPISTFHFEPGDVLFVPENQNRFGVMGQVARPNYYPLPEIAGDATVLKALALAGGANPEADLSGTTITRTVGGQTQTITVDAAAIMDGSSTDNVYLQKDDLLLVPKKDRNVGVIGKVARPGTFPLEDGMTLLSLLAEAGNPIAGAGLSRSYVLRTGQQIPVNLRTAIVEHNISEAIAGFKLQRNDVLVIPDISDQVQVMGQVNKPGPYSLDDDLTVISLLTRAGNITTTAAPSQAYVLRGGEKFRFDLRSSIAGNPSLAILKFRFSPGDVLVVPENQSRLAVMGQVNKPGYFPFPEDPNDASVLKVLSLAGGPINGGALNKAGIIRTVNGQPQVLPLDIDELFKSGNLAINVALKPDDILYIPPRKASFKWSDILGPVAAAASITTNLTRGF